ncbi:MAG: hypothetical protein EP343_25380 [Deltaproteobacteria bacterium]|nr:MAG: hypothetical protein EP343_25380 [Deltaproteobacteria bacterium]
MYRLLFVLVALCFSFPFLNCGNNGGNSTFVERLCTAQCKKLEECKTLSGQSVEDCATACKSSAAQAVFVNCNVTEVQINTCISAIEGSSCPFAIPAACSSLCTNGEGQASDGGNTTDDSTSDNATNDSSGGACGAVQGACVQKTSEGTQCQEYAGQLSVALTGLKKNCEDGKETTWTDGPTTCKALVPELNYGCEIKTPAGCVTSYDTLDAQQKAAASDGCVRGGGTVKNP